MTTTCSDQDRRYERLDFWEKSPGFCKGLLSAGFSFGMRYEDTDVTFDIAHFPLLLVISD